MHRKRQKCNWHLVKLFPPVGFIGASAGPLPASLAPVSQVEVLAAICRQPRAESKLGQRTRGLLSENLP
jgi:hypothetical protein